MASPARAAPWALALLAFIILVACLLATGSWRVYSNTWDEPEHLAAGVELLDRGKYEYDTEHPPLARVLIALGPYLAGAHAFGTPPPEGTLEGVDILYSGQHYGHYWRYLTLARLGTLPFLPLLLFATWLWARRLFDSPGWALLPVLLLVSVPPVLGHAALASLDVPAAATILLALYFLERWLSSGEPRHAAYFGLASGVAVATKFSGVPFIGLSLLVLALVHVVLARAGPRMPRALLGTRTSGALPGPGTSGSLPGPRTSGARGRPWEWLLGLCVAAVAALLVLFLVYAPRTPDPAGVGYRFHWAVTYLAQRPGIDHVLAAVLSHLWLPREFQDLVNGMVAVKAHNDTGHLSYLLGHTRLTGWWYFYLVALAVKTPIPLLIAGPVGLVWLAHVGSRRGDSWAVAPLVLVVTMLVFASSFSRINIGIRHILVLYPFFALGGAYVALRTWQYIRTVPAPRGVLVAAAALVAVLVWQLSVLWRAYPDYLPYFNEAVARPERVLVDSDLDWGQDLYRLEQRAAELGILHLSLAYRGTANLAREPLPPVSILPPNQPVQGWVAVSLLARTRNPSDYAWLDAYRPVERIGKTIDLYYVP